MKAGEIEMNRDRPDEDRSRAAHHYELKVKQPTTSLIIDRDPMVSSIRQPCHLAVTVYR